MPGSSFDQIETRGPITEFVEDSKSAFHQTMRLWRFYRSDHYGTLTTFAWSKGLKPVALPLDLVADTERLVQRYAGENCGYVLYTCRKDPQGVDELLQVVIGRAFIRASLMEHYKPLYYSRAYREDTKSSHQVPWESTQQAMEETMASQLDEIFSEGATEETSEEITQETEDVSRVEFFGEATA